MEVQLTSDQKAFARRAVESGRLHSEEEAIQEALALWEDRERRRMAFLATLDDSRAALSRGEGRVITQESIGALAAEVRERGRARLIDSITGRFFFLTTFPFAGRARDEDFGAGSRSFAVGEYVIVYCVEGADVFILRVVHGRRNLEALFD